MDNNNMMYAALAAMSGNSNLSKKDRFKEALLASFTSGSSPFSVILNSKKFIEKEEAKAQRDASLGVINNLVNVITEYNVLITDMKAAIDNGTTLDNAWGNNIPIYRRVILANALPADFGGLDDLPPNNSYGALSGVQIVDLLGNMQ